MTVPVLGVVGGGQLARMMHQEAIPLGVDIRFMVDGPDDPVTRVSPRVTPGAAGSASDLRRFAETVDVLTFDHEVVDLDALETLQADGHVLRPGAHTFATVSHKLRMRQALLEAGLPVPPFRATNDPDDAATLVAEHGPHVLKLAHGGYDGRGTFFVDDPEQATHIVARAAGIPVLVERRLDLLGEMAVLVVRRPGGETVVYDPVATIQVEGQCRRVDAPAPHRTELLDEARSLGRTAAEALDVVGVLAVELFLTPDGLLVNELAARPHNSGHHTLDGNVTSQFANHVRAVLDLPLGDPSPSAAVTVTANVIGHDAATDPAHLLRDALETDPAAHVHLYGKEPRTDRKLGHVTVCDDDRDRAVERVRRVVRTLGGQEVPR